MLPILATEDSTLSEYLIIRGLNSYRHLKSHISEYVKTEAFQKAAKDVLYERNDADLDAETF